MSIEDFTRGAETERAVIVAWLRMYTRLLPLARLIEAGAHELNHEKLREYCRLQDITLLPIDAKR